MARTPADNLPPSARAGFEALRRNFVTGLPARWREIEHAPELTARAAALHRLAGAAGSYGYEELGQAARAAEGLCSGACGAALPGALQEVDRLLRQAVGAAPPS